MVDLSHVSDLTLNDLINLHDTKKVLSAISKLTNEQKRSPSIQMLLSRINFLDGNILVAAEGFKYVIAQDPQSVLAHYELGICEFYRARFQQAKDLFKKVIKLDTDFKMAKYWLGRCYKYQLKHNKVIEIYSELHKEFPEWSIVACDLGVSYEYTGNVDKAVECFEKVVKLTRGNLIAYYHLGNMYQKRGELARALNAYKSGLLINPDSPLLKKAIEYCVLVDEP